MVYLGLMGFSGDVTLGAKIRKCVHAKLLQSCPVLCDPMDGSPPGSSVLEVLQARILEWVVMPSSRGLNLHFLCLLHCRQVLYH